MKNVKVSREKIKKVIKSKKAFCEEKKQKKKDAEIRRLLKFLCLLRVRYGINACFFLVFAHSFVTYDSVYEREKGVVFTDTNVSAGMNLRTSLTNEDIPCEHCLTVATLRAKAFCFAIASVVGRTRTFLMSE